MINKAEMTNSNDSSYANIALILAGGKGARFSSNTPKQYTKIGPYSILELTLRKFFANSNIDAIAVVINKEDKTLYKNITEGLNLLPFIIGGEERQDSARKGLEALKKYNPQKILIHDACRPFVTNDIINNIIDGLDLYNCVIPGAKVTDTLKKAENNEIISTISRENMYHVQTPQGVCFQKAIGLYRDNIEKYTDDAAIFENIGEKILVVPGSMTNIKITTQDDLVLAYSILGESMEIRTGIGFDAHKFKEDDIFDEQFIKLGGVKIPSKKALEAHSDGDVLIHSIVDSMLGAIGQGDIGVHFPPSDPKWKNADSKLFLEFAHNIIKQKGAEILNIDAVIICEEPKISSLREEIQKSIANILSLDGSRINIKGTTTEKMGFTGRKEGIAAQAITTIKMLKNL